MSNKRRQIYTRRFAACIGLKLGRGDWTDKTSLDEIVPEAIYLLDVHATMVDVGDPRWRLWLGELRRRAVGRVSVDIVGPAIDWGDEAPPLARVEAPHCGLCGGILLRDAAADLYKCSACGANMSGKEVAARLAR